jgi:cobalt-zinc-cadmium efflux system protein
MEKISHKHRDEQFSYGYKRFSLLAALINSLVLLVGSLFILFQAVPRLLAPQAVHVEGMFGLAILGIVVNGVAVLRLRRGKTMNEKVVSWHLLEDVLGWVAVLIISVVMLFKEVPILDPLFSIVFTAYILWNVFKNLKQTMMIFLQSIPGDIEISEVEKKISVLPDVQEVHDTHIWTMDGEYHILTTHVVVTENLDKESIILLKRKIKEVVSEFEIEHATLEIEREGEECYLKDC